MSTKTQCLSQCLAYFSFDLLHDVPECLLDATSPRINAFVDGRVVDLEAAVPSDFVKTINKPTLIIFSDT